MRYVLRIVAVALAGLGTGAWAAEGAAREPREAKQMDMLTAESRVLLQGDVLQIGFHGTGKAAYPEDIVPAGVLRALAQHQKVNLQTEGEFWGDYCYFAGVTGEAFRFMEFMDLSKRPPGKALVELYGQMKVEEMYRQAFEAAGLSAEFYLKPGLPEKAVLQKRIVESLRDLQTPVIGLGVFGPPEPFLITGYDEDGEVLLGWSHFMRDKKGDANLSLEPTGQFRLKNWCGAVDGIMVVTGTKEKADRKQVYRNAIERGIRELRTTAGGGAIGMPAMEKWAAYLENDAAFANLTEEGWKKTRSDSGSTAGDLAERRALAGSFLALAREVFPEAKEDLNGAGMAFGLAHDTVYEIWETIAKTGPFDPDLAKFKDPARRKTMAGLVRRLAALDQRGAAYLERALKIIDGKDPGAAIPPDALLDGEVTLKKAEVPQGPFTWAPENITLPNMMGMLRNFLGEPFGELNEAEKASGKLDYVLWMGYSGAAFGMLYDGPERLNLPLMFDALGYDYEIWASGKLAGEMGLPVKNWGWDDNLRRRIFWNLRDRQLPVLLFSCGKWPDWYLVTKAEGAFYGYGGDSGEGYRPNEPLDHPKNALKKIDLFDGMKGKETWTINVLAKRQGPKPAMEELYRQAIGWGAKKMLKQRMRLWTAEGKEIVSSHPYGDWAAMMRTDAIFPADQPEVLKARRDALEGDEVELAERRFYGAMFLDLAAARLNRPELREAARHFRKVTSLVDQIWKQLGGMHSPEGHLRLAEKETRERIVDLILEIEKEDAAAAAVLAR